MTFKALITTLFMMILIFICGLSWGSYMKQKEIMKDMMLMECIEHQDQWYCKEIKGI